MEIGRNRHGVPKCSKASGCIRPVPPLSAPNDIAAWEIFQRALRERQWVTVGDGFSGYRRDRLDFTAVKEIADSMEIELTDYLRSRIGDCQNWQLDEDARRRNERAMDKADAEEIVN